ncbi:MAG: hypothetical protein DLM67_13845 [Candidatus Nephthysia bennettiae]|nr:MAG: hypothetical protein DLM67_13845 [Candidatus Dormibacteraeota bacterium]
MAAVKWLVASTTFWTEHEGEEKLFLAGVSKIRSDHPVAKRAAAYFAPASPAQDNGRPELEER